MLNSHDIVVFRVLFQHAPEGSAYHDIWNKIQSNPDRSFVSGSKDAVRRMKDDPYIVYSADMTAVQNRVRWSKLCSFVILGETYFPSGFGIGIPKGSPYKRHFDKV